MAARWVVIQMRGTMVKRTTVLSVTRSGRSSRDQTLAELFARDPEAAVLHVLQRAGAALTAGEVKQALREGGVSETDADAAWPRVQRKIRVHERVSVEEGYRYRWTEPSEPAPLDALEQLAKGGLSPAKKSTLVAIVREALSTPPADLEEAARRRQAEIDGVRHLAALASEVEELAANDVMPQDIVRQVRAWVKRIGLEPIGCAGEETRFDRKKHKSIGPPIRDGAPVIVVRPGYVWKAQSEDVLVEKALVEE